LDKRFPFVTFLEKVTPVRRSLGGGGKNRKAGENEKNSLVYLLFISLATHQSIILSTKPWNHRNFVHFLMLALTPTPSGMFFYIFLKPARLALLAWRAWRAQRNDIKSTAHKNEPLILDKKRSIDTIIG